MTQTQRDPDVIDASPTKGFFIFMLIRDLSLRDAIGDLLDNSVDSARSVIENDDYSKILIEIELNSSKFSIKDNCAGMSVAIARDYAFRFGRPDTPNPLNQLKGSIGQFGIGMKRALFKIGKKIHINSVAESSNFELDVDVNVWEKEKGWDFKFTNYDEVEKNDDSDRGVNIIVENLKEDAKTAFNDPTFIQSLVQELEFEHIYPLSKGLTIKVNNYELMRRSLELLTSEEIQPAYYEHKFPDEVTVRILAGIGESKLEEGGWYIFGNNRLILGPEQSAISGWTGNKSDGVANYHGQFQMFRGYVFFESDNASLLPWNTAKNGVDIDSPKFKYVRQRMIELMKPIINFLNLMKKEREGDPSPADLFLQNKVNQAVKVPVSEVVEHAINEVVAMKVAAPDQDSYAYPVFKYPMSPVRETKKNSTVTITYSRSKKEVDLVKKSLNVSSNKEVGEATFIYYVESEL